MQKYKDEINKRYGKLTVIKRVGNDNKGCATWLCKCECGGIIEVQSAHLKNGNTKSCGCIKGNKKHGQRSTRLYRIWIGIKQRCLNPKNPHYKDYGGRGIKLFDDWFKFEPFYQWAVSNGYNDTLSIDRIDVNGNYEPSNCRWATRKEQANNTTKSIKITINNETHTITEWAKIYNIPAKMIFTRIKRGWDKEEAIRTPKLRNRGLSNVGKR